MSALMFDTPAKLAPEITWLIFYVVAFLLAVHRFRWAPGLFAVVLHTALQIAAFSARIYARDSDDVTLHLIRAIQALLAIALLALLSQLVILKSEHFYVSRGHPSSWLLRRYQLATHLLAMPLLFGALAVSIVYAALVGREDVRAMWHAFSVILLVFWALFVLWMAFTPFWARVNKAATGLFILLLILILLIPILYLELRWQQSTPWVASSMTAFHVLWILPQALVTIGILMLPISWWYDDDHRTRWIY